MSNEAPEQTQAQERRAAETAFAAASDEAPAKAATEKLEAPAKEAEPVKEKEPVADPWEGVPAVVREKLGSFDTLKNDLKAGLGRIAAIQIREKLGSFDTLKNDLKAGLGRIAAIQSEMAAARAAAKTVANAPTQAQIEEAAKSAQGWEDIKEFNPAWAAAIDSRIAADRAETLKNAKPVDVDGIKREVGESFTQALAKSSNEVVRLAREFARVDVKYPDWDTDIRVHAPDGTVSFTPEFAAWMKTQAPETQALVASESSRDAIKMLDLYYDHRKTEVTRAKNQQRLETAIPAKGTPGQRPSTPSERDAAEKAFASA